MGIYIKGMEMPPHCFNCSTKVDPDNRRCNIDGHVFEETLGKLTCWRDDACPLCSVPPHGRLGDLDALWVEINTIGDRRDAGIISDLTCLQQLLSAIRHIPTIIPADPAEEGKT